MRCYGEVWLVAVVAATSACSRAPAAVDRSDEETSATTCDSLPRRQCMETAGCNLELESAESNGRYRCRPARPPCETGVLQSELQGPDSGASRECAARSGCALQSGRCYCSCRGMGQAAVPDGPEASRCHCRCGGGPPAQCVQRR
jgi:hypothetical protein